MTDEELTKLGQDMIEEGRLSEFYQKKDRNLYMYEYHHGRYMQLKEQYHREKARRDENRGRLPSV